MRRRPTSRAAPHPPARTSPARGGRAARPGRDPEHREPGPIVPARVLRKDAEAGRHCDGDCQRSQGDHRRRADDGLGHYGAGPDPRCSRSPGSRPARAGPQLPRPRGGGLDRGRRAGDVCRAIGGEGAGGRAVGQPRMPYTIGLPGAVPRADSQRGRPWCRSRGNLRCETPEPPPPSTTRPVD